MAKSAVATMTLSASTASEVVEADAIAQESPSKRKLRMSVSCDNYLGDGKFSLSRRDSVGSGSPHSSKVKAFTMQARTGTRGAQGHVPTQYFDHLLLN